MKRGKGLKRDGKKARAFVERGRAKGLKRDPDRGLSADVEKVRGFEQRGRVSGAKALAASARRRPSRPKEGPLTATQWRERAFEASGGKCIVTRSRARDVDDDRFHVHHPLPKGVLRSLGLHEHVYDARNAAWVLERVHMQHETPGVRPEHRIARERLPSSVWEFCAAMDALHERVGLGEKWATGLVLRRHPAAGS